MAQKKKHTTRSSLCNPVMFSTVMKDEDLFRELLSRILPQKKIKELHLHPWEEDALIDSSAIILDTEHSIIINPYAKAVRFDVLFEDDDAWFDVEMQAADTKSLPQRSRYYHAAAAVDSLARGQEYIELKPGYVIFLCLFDLFGKDEPIYSFEMYDTKNLLHLRDGQLTMFLNTTCKKADIPEDLKTLYAYLAEGSVSETDPWIARLHNAVKAMEQEKEVRQKMTLYHEWIRSVLAMEKKLKASEEAREKAEAERMSAEQLQTLLKLLLEQGRAEEAKQALSDDTCRNALLREYGL